MEFRGCDPENVKGSHPNPHGPEMKEGWEAGGEGGGWQNFAFALTNTLNSSEILATNYILRSIALRRRCLPGNLTTVSLQAGMATASQRPQAENPECQNISCTPVRFKAHKFQTGGRARGEEQPLPGEAWLRRPCQNSMGPLCPSPNTDADINGSLGAP